MGLGADILMKIRTMFDSKPIDEAKKKTEDLGKTTAAAGKDASGGMNVMAAATAIMTGNINGAIAAIAPMIEKLKVLKLSLTQLTLVGAAIGALVALFKSMKDRAEAAAQAMAGIKNDNLRNEINSTAEAYDKLKQSMDDATAKGDAMLEYNQAMIDANKRLSLSLNDISKQRELNSAKTDDERRLIENKYKGKSDEISGMSEREKENASLQRSIEAENEINRKLQEAEDRKREAVAQAESASKSAQNASATGRGKIGWFSALAGLDRYSKWDGIAKDAGASTDKAITEFGEADADVKRLQDQKEALRRNREIAQKNRDAADRERTAARMGTTRESSDIQTDMANKSERERLQAEIDAKNRQQEEVEERFDSMKSSAARGYDKEKREASMAEGVAELYRKKGDRNGYDRALQAVAKESAEAEEAYKSMEAVAQEAAGVIASLKREIQMLQEQMKRIGQ